MATTRLPLSHSPTLLKAVGVLSLFPVGVGINAILRPRSALGLLEFSPPKTPGEQKLVDNLVRIFGVRTFAMGTTAAIVAAYGHATALGWVYLAMSVVPLVDGVVAKDQTGRGEWRHWGFVPVSVAIGVVLLGVFD